MGNEQQTHLQPPPDIDRKSSGSGFHSDFYDQLNIPSKDNYNIPSSFEQTVFNTLKAHISSTELEKLIESVENEVAKQYLSMPNAGSSSSFVQSVFDTLKAHNSAELDYLIECVEKEVSQQYKEVEIQKKEYDTLLLVPKENQIPNRDTIFRYMKQLGKGASCRVLKAKHVQNDKLYAVKELTKKESGNAMRFCEEVKLLKKLMHPNILHFYDCFMDNKCYYIATEYCSGGTMLQKISQMKSFSEQKASNYIRTILSAINYIHSLNIVHRDLKSANMVFDKHGPGGVLQIIDFGESAIVDDKQTYTEFVGTIHYMPPEIIRSRTGKELKKSDLWCVGVITYLLVCGRFPLNGKSTKEILNKIISKKKKIVYPSWIHLTQSCKHFISRLICDNISDRMSASEALQHEWISGGAACTDDLSNEVLKSLKRYDYDNKLQNILVNAILSEMDVDDQELLSQGIVEMNRNVTNLDSNAMVDHLLLYAPIKETKMLDFDWKKRRISEVKKFQRTYKPHSSEDETWNVDLNVITDILDEILTKESINSDYSDDMDDEEYEAKLKAIPDPENIATRATTQDIMQKRISVERFRSIMAKATKEYDIENIVDKLDDGTGYIPLNNIALYSKTINTQRNIFDGVQN